MILNTSGYAYVLEEQKIKNPPTVMIPLYIECAKYKPVRPQVIHTVGYNLPR
jgi:hypothetical protein